MWWFRILLLVFSTSTLSAQISWDPNIKDEIAPDVIWYYYRLDTDLERQSINILIISNKQANYQVVHSEDTLKHLVDFVDKNDIAAINGSFFNMREGGSVVFLQDQRDVVESVRPDRFTDEGALAISKKGELTILQKPSRGWKRKGKYRYILSSGPLLIENGELLAMKDESFYTTRHPRTAIGITEDGSIVFVTVDGRHERAMGYSIAELQALMSKLNCRHALNLDGGGSTTMWIKGKTENGVVNFPSDNKTFDHKGARRIANGVVISIP